MPIFHSVKSGEFCMISNSLASDPNISFKAKGIMLYLLSKPNDWKTYEKDIVNHTNDGRDSVRSGIAELVEAGYIVKERQRSKDGKLGGSVYNVFENLELAKGHEKYTTDGFSNIGLSNIGKATTTNTDVTKTDLTQKVNVKAPFSASENREQRLCPKQKRELMDGTQELLNYFLDSYRQYCGDSHPPITAEWINKFDDILRNGVPDIEYDRTLVINFDELKGMIDNYFDTEFPLSGGGYADHRIFHFLSDEVLAIRYYNS